MVGRDRLRSLVRDFDGHPLREMWRVQGRLHSLWVGPVPVSEQAPRLTYRVPEVARLLGVSRTLAYEWVEKGILPSIAQGKTRLVPVADLEQWVAQRTRRGSQ